MKTKELDNKFDKGKESVLKHFDLTKAEVSAPMQYDPHQGNKTNEDYCLHQLVYLTQVLGIRAYEWAHKPNPQLSGKSPMDVITEHEDGSGWKIVGNLISDMITGSPS